MPESNWITSEHDRYRSGSQSSVSRRRILGMSAAGLLGAVGGAAIPAAGQADTRAVGETGTVRTDQPDEDTWQSVSFANTYEEPVVIMKPVSADGGQPVHVRLRDISEDGFKFQFEEWAYLDGGHITATAHYLVVEAGVHALTDDASLEAGYVSVDENAGRVSFDASFGTRPVVFSQAQTYNGSHEIVTRNQLVSTGRFYVRLQEEEERNDGHTDERVGYVAVEPTATSGFEAGRTETAVTDGWYDIEFRNSYDSPLLVADMQTLNGINPAGLRYADLDGAGSKVRIEEERSRDDETAHIPESVGYLAVEPGSLFGGGSDDDGSDDRGEGVIVVEDFEDASLTAYTGDTGAFDFATAASIRGSASLGATDAAAEIATEEVSTPRGYEYKTLV